MLIKNDAVGFSQLRESILENMTKKEHMKKKVYSNEMRQ